MRRGIWIALVSMSLTGFVAAQSRPAATPRPAGAGPRANPETLKGEKRAHYIMRQLDLTEEQKGHANGLIDVYYKQKPDIDLVKLQVLISDGQKLEAQKKTEKDPQKLAQIDAQLEDINSQIRAMGQNDGNEEEFLTNLRMVLTPEQKTKLDETLKKLSSNPTGELHVADIVRFVAALKLNDEQQAKFREVQTKTYESANSQGNLDDAKRYAILKKMLEDLQGILDAGQMKTVNDLCAPGLAVSKEKAEMAAAAPATQPAKTPVRP